MCQSASQSVARSCVLSLTRDSVSVSQWLADVFFGAKHVIMSQLSDSQSVARSCVLSSTRDNVSVSQSVSQSVALLCVLQLTRYSV